MIQVLVDAVLLIQVALLDTVAVAATQRGHLSNQIGGADNDPLDDAEPFLGNKRDIRLGNPML